MSIQNVYTYICVLYARPGYVPVLPSARAECFMGYGLSLHHTDSLYFYFFFWFNNINDAHSNLNTLFLLEVNWILHSNKRIAIFQRLRCWLAIGWCGWCCCLLFAGVLMLCCSRNVTSSENWMNGNLSIYVFTDFMGRRKDWIYDCQQTTGKHSAKMIEVRAGAASNRKKKTYQEIKGWTLFLRVAHLVEHSRLRLAIVS